MATRQRTRARNQTGQRQTEVVQTGIVSKTNMNINQAQSVELAKTFLHSSVLPFSVKIRLILIDS